MKTIVVGADHAGFKLKEKIKDLLERWGYRVEDVGAHEVVPTDDYPAYAEKVALKVLAKRGGRGILACGTGIGASIAANKIPGIRAARAGNVKEARLSREHNDANLLVLGGWESDPEQIPKMVRAWLEGKFQGGRHRRRVNQISRIEKKYQTGCPTRKRGPCRLKTSDRSGHPQRKTRFNRSGASCPSTGESAHVGWSGFERTPS